MSTKMIALFGFSAALASGCAPSIGEARLGTPHAPLPVDCKLEFVQVGDADMQPNARFGPGGEYEMVGTVAIEAKKNAEASSEKIRKHVRPRACRMGGELVSLLGSGTGTADVARKEQNLTYTVWGRRAAQAPIPPAP